MAADMLAVSDYGFRACGWVFGSKIGIVAGLGFVGCRV